MAASIALETQTGVKKVHIESATSSTRGSEFRTPYNVQQRPRNWCGLISEQPSLPPPEPVPVCSMYLFSEISFKARVRSLFAFCLPYVPSIYKQKQIKQAKTFHLLNLAIFFAAGLPT